MLKRQLLQMTTSDYDKCAERIANALHLAPDESVLIKLDTRIFTPLVQPLQNVIRASGAHISSIILAGVSHLLHASNSEVASRVLPRTPAEISAYLLLCATAGFCEEIIFRGYLQGQFTAWTGSAYAGLVLQALVFGLAHGYQGARLMTVIAVFGCLFGLLAQWRQSLRPGMIAHFLQDASAVLLTLHR